MTIAYAQSRRNMMTDIIYTEQNANHSYRTETPNIIYELGLNCYELAVYNAIKKCAGDIGACTRSLEKLAKLAGMGITKLKNTISSLCSTRSVINKPLIIKRNRTADCGDRDTNEIVIIDIWPDNFNYFRKNNGQSPHASPQSPDDSGVSRITPDGESPHAYKEDPFKKNPIKKRERGGEGKEEKEQLRFAPPPPPPLSFSSSSLDFSGSSIKERENPKILASFDLQLQNQIVGTSAHLKKDKPTKAKLDPSESILHMPFEFRKIKMTWHKYAQLCGEFGNETAYKAIEEFATHVDKNFKSYKDLACFHAPFRSWILEKKKQIIDSPPLPELFIHRKVKMTKLQHEQLYEKFGKEKIDLMIERLADYGDTKPKKFKEYACHKTVIQTWIRRDDEEKQEKASKPNPYIQDRSILGGKKVTEYDNLW